jgi:hypothetical protein
VRDSRKGRVQFVAAVVVSVRWVIRGRVVRRVVRRDGIVGCLKGLSANRSLYTADSQ